MLKTLSALCLFLLGSYLSSSGQATATASRRADLQVGVGFVLGNPDYEHEVYRGGAFYTTLDFSNHFGAEFVIHQMNTPDDLKYYERTYELGGRYFRNYGRFSPYVKAMYGRGVFNFRDDSANLAYNLFSGGIGTDIHIKPYLNARLDYEYQRWLSFPPNGLTPQVLTIGVAYHFPGGLQGGRRR